MTPVRPTKHGPCRSLSTNDDLGQSHQDATSKHVQDQATGRKIVAMGDGEQCNKEYGESPAHNISPPNNVDVGQSKSQRDLLDTKSLTEEPLARPQGLHLPKAAQAAHAQKPLAPKQINGKLKGTLKRCHVLY